MENSTQNRFWGSKQARIILRILLTAAAVFLSVYVGVILLYLCAFFDIPMLLAYGGTPLLLALLIPLIYVRKRKLVGIIWGVLAVVFAAAVMINLALVRHEESLSINTTPNINTSEYLPFREDSKIARLDHPASLQLTDALPIVDGAAALFPVYSAFVNAVYPDTTTLYDGIFEYYNTSVGYMMLADKQTDIFFGVYPSEEQIAHAQENGTEFVYTPIGREAFVFFVHKDNPIEDLTIEQLQKIYSGEITNWKEVGGSDEPIAAFQRNEGSGSQSMLIRFMEGKPIMEAPTEMVNSFMSGIVEQVADYKSRSNSIGFSYRYYLEGIIQNPDIKLLRINGIAPSIENIKNGSYPVITPLYAVTYEGNEKENVTRLIEWVLSEEGQELIEKTGYAVQ